jgi:hypothetical protein
MARRVIDVKMLVVLRMKDVQGEVGEIGTGWSRVVAEAIKKNRSSSTRNHARI